MLPLLYNALWYPALPFALIASAGADLSAWRERLGLAACDQLPGSGKRIWVHAASVGEIEAVRPIALGLAREFPETAMAITTMTAAGREAARRRIPAAIAYQLAPLDWPFAVRSFVRRLEPGLLLIAETELWPNYFFEAARADVKIAIINGRISERSAGRYARINGLLSSALGQADLILAQTEADAARYCALGAPSARVIVTGNTKFDPGDTAAPLRPALAEFAVSQPILIAGSTAPSEERIVTAAYQELLRSFPQLALIVAPRHLARAAEVAAILQEAGLSFVKASDLPQAGVLPNSMMAGVPVLLLDTMGELRGLYRRATIAFVGGSLGSGRGGQNPAEPAEFAVPVMLGPYHENQREPVQALLAADGARIVRDASEIVNTAASWLSDDDARRSAGRNGQAAIARLGGGISATLGHLRGLMQAG
ncbi:MAG TPA: glycosyltransferase N-terminal domain-containing protein [Candidatus Binataceae bacterium]|nr:glycosyltransferase N-terminal domain-containing protein [Candidatus Binataceae bacterium]